MGTALRVLVIEDNPDDAEVMVLQLARGGFAAAWKRVDTEADLRAALAGGGWDVALSDYTLPGFGALAALAVVREIDPDLPFIVVSGTVGEEVAAAVMRAGAGDYVLKDNLSRLAPAVGRELREADNRRARRRAENDASRLAALVHSSEDAIIGETLDGIVTDWNPAAERLYGWTAAEAVGRHASFLAPPERRGDQEAYLERLRRGEHVPAFETVRLHRDGTPVEVSVTLSPVRDAAGRLVGVSKIARDIRERRRAEAALRASEARFRALVEKSFDGVLLLDAAGTIRYASPSAARVSGRPAEEYLGRKVAEFKHPEEAADHAAGLAELVRHPGADFTGAARLRHADGSWRWVESRFTNLLDDPAVGAVVVNFRDITDRQRAEAERDELLTRLNLQIERLPLAYLLSGPDFRYTRWNPAAEQTFGFAAADVLGKHPFEVIVPPHAQPVVADLFARLRAGDMHAHGTGVNVTRDGRLLICEWHNTPLFGPDGAFQGILSLAQDVTERYRDNETLRLRDRAMQAVTQGIVITDPNQPDNPIIYASPGFERLTGHAQAEVLGRNCRFLQGKDTDPDAVARLGQAIRSARPVTVEMVNYRKDGTAFRNELSVSPVHDEGGRLTHFVGAQTDVTERRLLEEQYRQAQKMEAVGQLAGGVAHDFNNLLTVINGYTELLLQSLPADDPNRALLTEVRKAGERSAALTRQLLLFSRKQLALPRVLDLNDVIVDIEKLLRRTIGEDVRLETDLRPLPGRVRADPGQVEQVLVNLAVNARDAMPQGGRLTVRTRAVLLDADFARRHPGVRPGPHVLLDVADTGSGMTPEVKARLFEPFFTTKGAGKGTGLGMAVVHGIVRQAEGHIEVDSEPGRGTRFRIHLPLVDLPASSGKSDPGTRAVARGCETLLLVEDEANLRGLTRRILANCGYTVLEAANADEALRLAERQPPPLHLLVTDVVLPGPGGREVAEGVVRLHPEARVLFVSGYIDDAVLRHGVREEEVHFLRKPFTPAALAAKVREVLDQGKQG